jgi:plastocyanin
MRAVLMLGLALSAPGPWLAAQGSLSGRVTLDAEAAPGAVVYLVPSGSTATAPVLNTVIDQRSLRFRPPLVVVTPGSVVAFLNSDSLLHNVFSPGGPDGPFDLGTYTTGERRERTFSGVGTHVILCHVHPEMVAYIVTVPTAWYAVADSAGQYDVRAVPPGVYRLTVAHRRRHDPAGTVSIGTTGRVHKDLTVSRTRPATRGR